MSYTAIEKMREINKKRYGIDFPRNEKNEGLSKTEISACKYIRELCEEFHFDKAKTDLTDRDGTSASANQIPFNMEKDIDRMCLENAVHRFMNSKSDNDAFNIYFCLFNMLTDGYDIDDLLRYDKSKYTKKH